MYASFDFPGTPPPEFARLARCILSVCANSASCERLFSVFGATLSKLRNRLGINALEALAELKMHVRDENLWNHSKKQLKRMFAVRNDKAQNPSSAGELS